MGTLIRLVFVLASARRRSLSSALVGACLIAVGGCARPGTAHSSPSEPARAQVDTCEFPSVIELPDEPRTTGWIDESAGRGQYADFRFDSLPWSVVGQSIRLDGPTSVFEALNRNLPDCSICAFRVSRVRGEAMRLAVVDVRKDRTLVEQRADATDDEDLVSALVFRVHGPIEDCRVTAIGLYAIHCKSMTLVSSASIPEADDPVALWPEFADLRIARQLKPREAAGVLYCWSQNGGMTDRLATVLFERGTDENEIWAGNGYANNFDDLRALDLKQWPKPVWMLVVSRG